MYLAGAYCAALETANVNLRYETRRYMDGERDTMPKVELAPIPSHFDSDFLSFYGAYSQYAGVHLAQNPELLSDWQIICICIHF